MLKLKRLKNRSRHLVFRELLKRMRKEELKKKNFRKGSKRRSKSKNCFRFNLKNPKKLWDRLKTICYSYLKY